MKVVLNTSPIIFLSKVESLTLLTDCCAEIYVPQAVIDELHDYSLPEKIITRSLSPEGVAYVQGALGRLHLGELEAIRLAQELSVDYVILDDLLARRKAQHLGIEVIGTLGILLLLKKRGLLDVDSTWLKIIQLTSKHGLYVSTPLLQQIKGKLIGG